ncbi:MAG: hypothetical protein KGH88_05675 [Thaumarchaeota archaeon]|nr:hypothetical protein [Nitrososphaerota archaeon]
MAKRKQATNVIGSIEFRRFYDSIYENDLKKEFSDAFKILKEDCLRGNKIPHSHWPSTYVRKYGIRNLWIYPMRSGWRITYTILQQEGGIVVCILEAFSHREYEKRFGY